MEQEQVNLLIEKYTGNINYNRIRKARGVVVIVFVMAACFLVTMKSFIATGILFLLSVCEFVYFSVITRKGSLTLYKAVTANIILFLQLAMMFNVALYFSQKHLGGFDDGMSVILYITEIICFFLGIYFTCRRVRKGTVHKIGTASPVLSLIPCVIGIVISSVLRKADADTEVILYSAIFTFASSLMLFSLGMTYAAIAYYIYKLDIPDREINDIVP